MTARCDLTDLLVDGCAHCRGHDKPATREAVETVGQPFPARYPGMCGGCEGRFAEGDPIARAADRDLGYIHADQRDCAR